MYHMTEPCREEHCPVARAMEVLDGKWTVLIIRDLLGGTRRFTQLRSSLAGISPKTLTDRLRSLEEHALVRRTIFAEVPPRVEYEITPNARRLRPIFVEIVKWAQDNEKGVTAPAEEQPEQRV